MWQSLTGRPPIAAAPPVSRIFPGSWLVRGALATIAIGAVLASSPLGVAAADETADYAFVQKPGSQLPLDVLVHASDGQLLRLGALFAGRPVIFALGYFHCPSLCGVVRDDLFEALRHSGLATPSDYSLVIMSIDPAEGTADAASALADDLERYPTPGAAAGWHFVTGDSSAIGAAAEAVGFQSRYDTHLRQFLHPAGVVILSPDGRVSGYVMGVGYNGGDLGGAVTLASSGGIAKAAMPILMLCFHYDAVTGRYSLAIVKVLRLAGAVAVLMIGLTVALLWRWSGRAHRVRVRVRDDSAGRAVP